MSKKKRYAFELKKQVVKEYFEGYSVPDLVEKYGIGNRRRVYEWATKVREGGYAALEDKRGLKSKGKKKKDELSLEEKYERLKLENLYLKKLLALKRG